MLAPTKVSGPRSRYYDAIIKILENDIKAELNTPRAKYAYAMIHTQLARLAAVNDHAPFFPENLSALSSRKAETIGVPSSEVEWRKLLEDEGDLLDEIESATDRRRNPEQQAAQSEETNSALPSTITNETVGAYLRDRLGEAVRVSSLHVLSGGRSKQTILLDVVDGHGKKRDWVIRRDMGTTNPTGGTVPEEFAVLDALYRQGIPVPRPILCEPDKSKLGTPFIVVEKILGLLAGHLFDPPSEAAVLDSARVLGRLHALAVEPIATTMREKSRAKPDTASLLALISDLRNSWNEQSRAVSVTVDYAFDWLAKNAATIQPLTAVVHGDYSYHNILFHEDRLTAVLDWELVRVGHPAEDLGYVRPAVLHRVSWNSFMAAYHEGGGPTISPKDLLFFTLLEKIRLMIMLFKVRGFVESGLSDDIELVNASIFMIPRLIHQMSMELRGYLAESSPA